MRLTAESEEDLVAAPISGAKKSLDTPDDRFAKGGVQIDIVQIGNMKVKRATYPAGFA